MKSYFTRLVAAFLLTSLIPILIAGISFYMAGHSLVLRNAKTRAEEAIQHSVTQIHETIETYRHVAYVISKDENIIQALNRSEEWNSKNLKILYQHMYAPLDGHIYSAAAHIISRNGEHSFSTHSLPKRYDLRIYENLDGIFSERRTDPEKSYIYIDPFVTARGDRVALTILREIPDGYVIIDVYAAPFVSAEFHPYFDTMLIADRNLFKAFDFYNPERDGTFDKFEELQLLGRSLYAEKSVVEGGLLTISAQIPDTPLFAVGGVHLEGYFHNLYALGFSGTWFLLGLVVVIFLIAFRLSRSISGPVHSVVRAMQSTEQGYFTYSPELNRKDELGYLVHTYNSMVSQLEKLIKQVREEERALQIAERKALQAQINPHFLYNTLGTIKSMSKLEKPKEISDIVTRLGKLLRNTFSHDSPHYSINHAVEIIHDYIAIQKYRYADRLQIEYNIDPAAEPCKIPRLLLQPIVENALIHSVEKTSEMVTIKITVTLQDNQIEIIITDNGPGFIPSPGFSEIKTRCIHSHYLENPDKVGTSNGIGIANVQRRIELAYGDRGFFDINSEAGQGTCVTIRIPKEDCDEYV